ncbi:MAG: hypothetical protein WCT49_02620 [Candidatus Paceibacterota bacterium]|jgi:hypothetical protein|nr:hypothetical protein [Candidatus Paceibacterota bacterium]
MNVLLEKMIVLRHQLKVLALPTFILLFIAIVVIQAVTIKITGALPLSSYYDVRGFVATNIVWEIVSWALLPVFLIPEWYRYVSMPFTFKRILTSIVRVLFWFTCWLWWVALIYAEAVACYASIIWSISVW